MRSWCAAAACSSRASSSLGIQVARRFASNARSGVKIWCKDKRLRRHVKIERNRACVGWPVDSGDSADNRGRCPVRGRPLRYSEVISCIRRVRTRQTGSPRTCEARAGTVRRWVKPSGRATSRGRTGAARRGCRRRRRRQTDAAMKGRASPSMVRLKQTLGDAAARSGTDVFPREDIPPRPSASGPERLRACGYEG
jgi:hypothetical protein